MSMIEHQGITHHIPQNLLVAYASGQLEHAFALVVAAHVSLCAECRAELGAHEAVGGALIDQTPAADLSAGLRNRVLAQLDDSVPDTPVYPRQGPLPSPVMAALGGKAPVWQPLGTGVRQCILRSDSKGSARLLSIPPGHTVPEHGHRGLELTLVLRGSFFDDTGTYVTGDVEVANSDMAHIPVAAEGPACVCLAATDAPLRFKGIVPRLFQPFFRI